MNGIDLSQLRDIHLPAEPSWWPPGPIFWILLLAMILLLASLYPLYHQRRKRKELRMHKIVEQQRYQLLHGLSSNSYKNYAQTLQQINSWLKWMAMIQLGSEAQNQLNGKPWTRWLDQFFVNETPFTTGIGQVLQELPYQKNPQIDARFDIEPLIQLCLRWAEASKNERT